MNEINGNFFDLGLPTEVNFKTKNTKTFNWGARVGTNGIQMK